MPRRGRPPATDSAETRARILDAALNQFATHGYAAAAIAAIAAEADLAPSAIYHYYGGKPELYEAVFDAITKQIWTTIGEPENDSTTMREAVASIVDDERPRTEKWTRSLRFYALVPVEANLHPEFEHVLQQQSAYQDRRFTAMAQLGVATGELPGFEVAEAVEFLRTLFAGWFFERYLTGRTAPGRGKLLLAALDAVARR